MADQARDLLRYFTYQHLPPYLQEVSAPFLAVASEMHQMLPPGPEKDTTMRKLVEAKDCAVRAASDLEPGEEPAGE